MRRRIFSAAITLLLVSGCSTLDQGESLMGDSSGDSLASAFAPDDPRGILARAGGTDIGLTQRSTAADGTVVFHAEAPLLAEDQNVFEDIYLRTPDEELIRITRAFTGAEPNNVSTYPCVSDDGNIVAFCSRANNLVPDDANNDWDVFVHDRSTGVTSLVSVDSNGVQGTRRSLLPSLSADGTKVTFVSQAPLTPDKTSTRQDVFVRDLTAGTTTLVSHDGAGGSGNSHSYDPVFSGDGTKIAYASNSSNLVADDTNGRQDIFIYDLLTGVTQRVTDGNSHSYWPSLSTDGSKLAFTSLASNLVAGDTNARRDVFVWDGTDFTAVTHGDGHAGRVVINGPGNRIAFASEAENLAADGNGFNDVFRATLSDIPGTLERVTDGIPPSGQPSMNPEGTYLSHHSPGGEVASVFTPLAAPLELISRGVNGPANQSSANPSLSGDGRFVSFESNASNLIANDFNGAVSDIFVYDRETNTTELVSSGLNGQGNSQSYSPSISFSGRYVAFVSAADNLVESDTNSRFDVFVYDRQSDQVEQISKVGSLQGNSDSSSPSISHNGQLVAFSSHSTNLVLSDTNGKEDIFLADRTTGSVERVSVGHLGQANDYSLNPSISGDGSCIAFQSFASNLVPGDTNGHWDIFVLDRGTAALERVSIGVNGQANNSSTNPSISADGRYVAFRSYASNLVAGDTNGTWDIFVYDRETDAIEIVSTGPLGQSASQSVNPSISADGRYVAFRCTGDDLLDVDTNGQDDIYVYDRHTDLLELVSTGPAGPGDGYSVAAKMSPDGTFIGFYSAATNLHADDTNSYNDVFVTPNPLYTP